MPTYEYMCSAGHRFERFQRMSEAPLDKCPECDAPAERLLSSGAGLLFKGSGFYITDYRSDSYKKAAEADKGASTPSDSASKPSDGGSKASDGGSSSSGSGESSSSKSG
jgi:putative FmdB family regulatory protein